MANFQDAERDADDLAKLVNEAGFVTTRYGDNPKRSWQQLQDEFDSTQAGEYVAQSVSAADRAEAEADRAEAAADDVLANQPTGVIVFTTYVLLDAYAPADTDEQKASYKVTNDPDSSLNGYYHWVSDTTYEKDADLVVNTIDENNTSDAVSGAAVYDVTSKKGDLADVLRLESESAQGAVSVTDYPVPSSSGKIVGGIVDDDGKVLISVDEDGFSSFHNKISIQGQGVGKSSASDVGFLTEDGDVCLGVSADSTPVFGGLLAQDLQERYDIEFGIADEEGRVAISLDQAGNLAIGGGTGFEESDKPLSIEDMSGNRALSVDEDGTVSFIPSTTAMNHIKAGLSDYIPDDDFTPSPMPTELLHIVMHGQSLSVGLGSRPVLTAESTIGTIMPDSGLYDGLVHETEGLDGPPVSSSAFAPLTTTYGTDGNETPVASAAEQLQFMINQLGTGESDVLASCCGHGGYRIDQLDKEGNGAVTPLYELGVEQALHYKTLADNMDKSLSTTAMLWVQGETDISVGTDTAEYKRRLYNLIKDFGEDISQSEKPVLITYQVGSHTKRSPNSTHHLAVAQFELSLEKEAVRVSCPTYMFSYNGDGVHLGAHSSRWLGAYMGKAVFEYLNGDSQQVVYPKKINRNDKTIIVQMNVPVPPLVLDTTIVSDPGSYGFSVEHQETGELLDIASVSLVGTDSIKIKLVEMPTSPVTVGYALGYGLTGANAGHSTGARGNVRDSDATLSYLKDSNDLPYTLYNWCVMSEIKE